MRVVRVVAGVVSGGVSQNKCDQCVSKNEHKKQIGKGKKSKSCVTMGAVCICRVVRLQVAVLRHSNQWFSADYHFHSCDLL